MHGRSCVEKNPIDRPTRALWGAPVPVLPAAWADRLADFFTDLQVKVLPEAGHFVRRGCPDRAAAEIAAIFNGRAAR